jgi:hypothetical protein
LFLFLRAKAGTVSATGYAELVARPFHRKAGEACEVSIVHAESVAAVRRIGGANPFAHAESMAGLRRIGGALFITEHFRTFFTEHSSEFSEKDGSKK